MKKVLLLGGAGFIGFSIAKYLAKRVVIKLQLLIIFLELVGK